MDSSFWDNVCVESVAEVYRIDVITVHISNNIRPQGNSAYHSKSLYMIVKKTCRNRLTAFISTASRYSHASPDIMETLFKSVSFFF